MKLILVRHGRTRENEKGISQGQKFGTLSKHGLEQVELVAKRLKDTKIDVIYTSDLARAFRTTKAIAKYHPHLKIKRDKLLRELDHGEFSGKVIDPLEWDKIPGKRFGEKRSPGGENLLEVKERASKFYEKILKKHPDETVLVVTHGGVLYGFVSVMTNKPLWVLREELERFKNTGVSEFEINKKGEAKIIHLNCYKHL